MNVDPYLNLTYEKREKMKEELQDHFEGKKKKEFGINIFQAISKAYSQQFPGGAPPPKFPDLHNATAEEAVKSLDAEILKNASDDVILTTIKQDIDAGRAGIKEIWEATRIYMPKTYGFLEDYTQDEFKRISLIRSFLGLWLPWPTVGEEERAKAKKYFKTYLHLLEDRGTEQDKHFHHFPLKAFKAKDKDERIPDVLQRVLDKDEEDEKYNEPS